MLTREPTHRPHLRSCLRNLPLFFALVIAVGATSAVGQSHLGSYRVDRSVSLVSWMAAQGNEEQAGEPDETSSEADAPPEEQGEDRWSSFLPLLADEAKEAGYDLPLPLGISVNYLYATRDVKVENLEIAVNGGESKTVDEFLSVDADSDVNVVVFRLDAFIFPFLNVYVLGNWIENDSNVRLDVNLPLPGPLPPVSAQIERSGTLEGWGWGAGATIAGGYEDWFFGIDTVYSEAQFDELDSNMEAIVLSGRGGWMGKVYDRDLRVWLGATYWDTARDVKGNVRLPSGDTIRYKVQQGPVNPWNMNYGANFEIYAPFELTMDIGTNYDDMLSFLTALSYRF